ncbi:MAG TPA: glutamate racemase, partial [Elusimicrobia bacterium]|nr:glutamate racemase [Elusimicrobiota bacterium]
GKSSIKVFSHPCPLFVPLVEEGWLTKEVTYRIAEEYLSPLKKEKIDVLLLGCTHYPLLKTVIHKVVGEEVTIIDSASETVKEVKRLLEEKNLLRENRISPRHLFYVSDAPEKFQSLSKHFLGSDYKKIAPIHLKSF